VVGILFGSLFAFPQSSWAACLNSYQTQTLAAAYEGDDVPTVHTIEACGGDDVSYQIPIATTINFDGVQYSAVYATTNSVITFGNPDNTYWDYPQTPSISLYSMDWVIYPSTTGWGRPDESMIISYSEGGFQIDMNLRPIWLQSQPEPVNIVINAAITNTGGLAISYSTAFPATGVAENYAGLRTGVRLHNGQVVSLESAGFYEVQDPATLELTAAPVDEETYVPGQPQPEPSPTPTGPTQEEIIFQEEARVTASLIANAIAAAQSTVIAEPDPTPEIIVEPTPEPETTTDSDPTPEPDVEIEPEIITPEDPRFPDNAEQTEPEDSNPSPTPEITDEATPEPTPDPEPSEEPTPEPSPQPTDIDPEPTPEPEPTPDEPSEEPSQEDTIINLVPQQGEGTTEDLSRVIANLTSKDNKIIKLTADQMAAIGNTLLALTEEAKAEVAKDLGVKEDEVQILAETAKDNPAVAIAIATFAEKVKENADAPMPYTVADAITEAQAEQFLSDPLGTLTNIDLDKVFSPSEWGKDMTDDQREKVQEVVVPVILVGNIVSSVMSLRRL
jgi:hypothetical protein